MAYADLFRGLNPKGFARKLAMMARAKDVLFDPRDPLPFFLMTPMSFEILKRVAFAGESFGEASTRDIEWKGSVDADFTKMRPAPSPVSANDFRDVRDAAHGT